MLKVHRFDWAATHVGGHNVHVGGEGRTSSQKCRKPCSLAAFLRHWVPGAHDTSLRFFWVLGWHLVDVHPKSVLFLASGSYFEVSYILPSWSQGFEACQAQAPDRFENNRRFADESILSFWKPESVNLRICEVFSMRLCQ